MSELAPRLAETPRWPPKTPRTAVPAGAWDCHFHVFTGPDGRVDHARLSPARVYDPPAVGLAEIQRLHDHLGFARGVIVQGSVYGTDNAETLAALRAAQGRYRGIAVIGAQTPERELDDLAAAGVCGVRVNVLYGGGVGFAVGRAIEARVKARGWHIQLLIDIAQPSVPWDWLERASVPLVFDHFGHFDARLGPQSAGFQRMLRLARDGRAWVKITGPTRISAAPAPSTPTYARSPKRCSRRRPSGSSGAATGRMWPCGAACPTMATSSTISRAGASTKGCGGWYSSRMRDASTRRERMGGKGGR